nr:reverse transcriptase domain-containing protein [Tanacetum cinerariifolium]
FYNGLTLRHRDTINAAAGGTFMKRRPKECYDLIKDMTVHHNDWDTSIQRSESSSSITSSSDPKIVALKAEMEEINKNLMKVLQINQQVKAVAPRTLLNEHCLAVLLKKLPEKLGDPDKFLIPFDLPGMGECLALADLGASINLMPLSMWNKLSLPELSPTCMTLELADRLISHLTEHALIDVYEGELTLRVAKEAMAFNLDQTSRYSANYDAMSVNRIDLIDVEPIISISSLTLTPFGDSDFLLEETDAFLAIDDEPISPKIDDCYYDSGGDILLLEEFLNDDPSSPPLPPQELKVVEPTNENSSIDESSVVELKDLPPHLEYAFLEGDDKLPVIIAKDLKVEEKTAHIEVLKSHKQALAWQLSDIKGINPKFCTHKILMEDDFKPAVQHQRRANPKIHEVIKKEVDNFFFNSLNINNKDMYI